MPSLSSVYPSATQVLLLYLCKRYATEPVHPPEGYHVPTRMRERLVYEAVSADAGWCSCTATQQVSARERRAASVADDTRDGRDAWPGWGEGSGGLVVGESARQDVCCFGTTRRRGASRRIGHTGQAGALAQSVQRPLWLSCSCDSGCAGNWERPRATRCSSICSGSAGSFSCRSGCEEAREVRPEYGM